MTDVGLEVKDMGSGWLFGWKQGQFTYKQYLMLVVVGSWVRKVGIQGVYKAPHPLLTLEQIKELPGMFF